MGVWTGAWTRELLLPPNQAKKELEDYHCNCDSKNIPLQLLCPGQEAPDSPSLLSTFRELMIEHWKVVGKTKHRTTQHSRGSVFQKQQSKASVSLLPPKISSQ